CSRQHRVHYAACGRYGRPRRAYGRIARLGNRGACSGATCQVGRARSFGWLAHVRRFVLFSLNQPRTKMAKKRRKTKAKKARRRKRAVSARKKKGMKKTGRKAKAKKRSATRRAKVPAAAPSEPAASPTPQPIFGGLFGSDKTEGQ